MNDYKNRRTKLNELKYQNKYLSIFSKSKEVDKELDNILDEIQYGLVRDNMKEVSNSQLRNIYNEILKQDTVERLKLLRPKFAYIASRQNNFFQKKAIEFIENIMKENVNSTDDLENFKKFMEAVVAYHKYHSK